MKNDRWTREEDELLRQLYGTMSWEKIAKRLDRTREGCRGRAVLNGLTCPQGCISHAYSDNEYMYKVMRGIYD